MSVASRPPPEITSVVATDKLRRRTSRAPHLTDENTALHSLARAFAKPPGALLCDILKAAIRLCGAGSAGMSLLERQRDGAVSFRWIAMAGRYERFVGGTTPRDFSPCGYTLDAGEPQLFEEPDRVFPYFRGIEPRIIEGLVVPVVNDVRPLGTIWVVSHAGKTEFDMEDVRVMTSLGGFASYACSALTAQLSSTLSMAGR